MFVKYESETRQNLNASEICRNITRDRLDQYEVIRNAFCFGLIIVKLKRKSHFMNKLENIEIRDQIWNNLSKNSNKPGWINPCFFA